MWRVDEIVGGSSVEGQGKKGEKLGKGYNDGVNGSFVFLMG